MGLQSVRSFPWTTATNSKKSKFHNPREKPCNLKKLDLFVEGACTSETHLPFRSLGLAVPVTLLYVFSLALQTYVLRLDVIVAVIGLVFVGFEGLLSVGTAVSFYHAFRG